MKKATALILSLVLSLSSVCYAMQFKDVDPNTEEGEAIIRLYEKGYINGYNESEFAPFNKITRAEFVKIVNRVFSFYTMAENIFTDVYKGQWFYNDICIAQNVGYIKGMGDGRFCPEDNITREQAIVIVDNILKMERLPLEVTISDNVSDWAKESVEKAVLNGLIELEENDTLRATEPIKRGETALMLSKCIIEKPDKIEPIDLESMADEEVTERINNIVKALKEKTLPLCYLKEQTDVVNSLIDSMQSYLKDRKFDYKKAKEETFEIYKSMKNRPDRLNLQNMITGNVLLDDLVVLYGFFFPEDDLKIN